LVAFSDARIATEGTILFNALICTVLVLLFAREPSTAAGLPPIPPVPFGRGQGSVSSSEINGPNAPSTNVGVLPQANYSTLIRKALLLLFLLLFATTLVYTTLIRALYGDQWTGWGGNNRRFGPDADWRVKPILKSRHHN